MGVGIRYKKLKKWSIENLMERFIKTKLGQEIFVID